MRIIVLFDLPVESAEDRSEYGKFRRSLIKAGFLMMQESIYCKLAVNSTMAEMLRNSNRLEDWYRYSKSQRSNTLR